MKILKKTQGFTLVELIVVITILAILGTVGFISFQGYTTVARDSTRMSDMSSIGKTMSLFYTENSYFPDPTDSIEVTYSGSLAWRQGTYGEATRRTGKRMSKVPNDPLTGNEYAYSVTHSRQEYELGSILEKSQGSLGKSIAQSYAANNAYYSYITGNYNKKFVMIEDANKLYFLGVPTLITTEIVDVTVQQIHINKSFAIKGSNNLPSSYKDKLPDEQDYIGATLFTAGPLTTTTAPLLYEGTSEELGTTSGKIALATNLKSYYAQGSNGDSYTASEMTGLADGGEVEYVNTLIQSNTAGLSPKKVAISEVVTENSTLKTGEAAKFISTWNTVDKWGVTGPGRVELPLHSSGNYNFTVDWGDGNIDTITSYNQAEINHDYDVDGTYTISIEGIIEGFSCDTYSDLAKNKDLFTRLREYLIPNTSATTFAAINDCEKINDIQQWGNVRLANTGRQFAYVSFSSISATDELYLNNVTNMSLMFRGARFFNGNISSWNVSNVTDMSSMFSGATAFNGNISSWNVQGVTNMSSMFSGATAFNGTINSWNVRGVTNMSSMFSGATAFNRTINSWNVQGVTDMSSMFSGATAFNQDLISWNVQGITDMSNMFSGATAFNGNINSWNVQGVTNMLHMFSGAEEFNQNLNSWNVQGVVNMSNMFGGAESFNQDLNSWDVSDVINMSNMFLSAASFNGNLSSWNVSNVTNMSGMFGQREEEYAGYPSFNTIPAGPATIFNSDISGWDIGNVTDMSFMFTSNNIFDRDISGWDITNMADTTDYDVDTNASWTAGEKPCFGNTTDANLDGEINCSD